MTDFSAQILFFVFFRLNNFVFENYCISLRQIKDGMRVVSHKKLKDFYTTKGHENSRVALQRWYDIAIKAEWKNFSDVKADFSAVDNAGNQHYVFNIKGNDYRLVVVIKFVMGYIYIRFVGTHDEYDKIDC